MQSVKDNINIKYSEGNCRVLSRWLSCNACRVRMAYQSQKAHKEVQAALDTKYVCRGKEIGAYHCYSRRLDHHCKVYASNTMQGFSQGK